MRRGGDENIVRYAAPPAAEEEEELDLEENQPLSEVGYVVFKDMTGYYHRIRPFLLFTPCWGNKMCI